MFQNWSVKVEPWVDLRFLLPEFQSKVQPGVLPDSMSRVEVSDLSATFFGDKVKPFDETGMLRQQFSWWAALELNENQLLYASYLSQVQYIL